jgi:protoporphyrinogen oxidase
VNEQPDRRIVIIGGGATGLCAAWKLAERGLKPLVLEKADQVGGLGHGRHVGPNVYEYGPHSFHSDDPEIRSKIENLLGDELVVNERAIKIKFKGKFVTYPLTAKDIIMRIPISESMLSFFSFLYYHAHALILRPKYESSEDVLVHTYGRRLYDTFFREYTHKVWGVWLKDFSPDFAMQRIPMLDVVGTVKKFAEKFLKPGRPSSEKLVEMVSGPLYYTRQGHGRILERIAEEVEALGGEIRLHSDVTGVNLNNGVVDSVTVRGQDGNEITVPVESVISTAPIPMLVSSVSPEAPSEVKDAAASLRYKPLVFAGYLINKPYCTDAMFTYFRNTTFNRLTDEARFQLDVTPEGSTILVAEVTCEVGDENWAADEAFLDRIQEELVAEGLFEPSEVMERHAYRYECTYPIYTKGYEKSCSILIKYFDSIPNLVSTGRQGAFLFINTHVAMKYGFRAADEISSS